MKYADQVKLLRQKTRSAIATVVQDLGKDRRMNCLTGYEELF
jgi:hypothetical protein